MPPSSNVALLRAGSLTGLCRCLNALLVHLLHGGFHGCERVDDVVIVICISLWELEASLLCTSTHFHVAQCCVKHDCDVVVLSVFSSNRVHRNEGNRTSGHMLSSTGVSARSVIPWHIISADPKSPLIPKETTAFVSVESLHMIPHRLILSFILHDIRGTRPFHSISTSARYSLPRNHFALVGFFVFLHYKVLRAISDSRLSIGGPPICTNVSLPLMNAIQQYRRAADTLL